MKIASSKVHFIGIGGIGMSGLAELLSNMGAQVSGSDQQNNKQVQYLRSLGIPVSIGHDETHIEDQDVVVFSSAIKANNVEFQEARRRGIPLIPRAEALAEMMRLKRGIAVAGTHGKTTTTSLVATLFLSMDVDPTIVIGGRLDLIKSTAKLGTGEWLIAEADESDGSFSRLSPEVVIITNIDNDHLDYYGNFQHLKEAFYDFASRVPFYGVVVAWGDSQVVREVFRDFPKRVVYYGFNTDNDYVLREASLNQYELINEDRVIGRYRSPLLGRHNALNALAAMIVGVEAGFTWEQVIPSLEGFAGVDRRLQFKGHVNGCQVVDDYGHHPTEIRAVLEALRESYPQHKIKVIFQPHRYSRTEDCWQEFLHCFTHADEVYLTDIYAAGEVPREGVSTERLLAEIQGVKTLYFRREMPFIEKFKAELNDQHIVVTLGAGDIWKIAEQICEVKD